MQPRQRSKCVVTVAFSAIAPSSRALAGAQIDRIHGIVKDTVAAGAKLSAGGTFDGPCYRPTVLSGVKPGNRAPNAHLSGPLFLHLPEALIGRSQSLSQHNP